jgi:hypothetical protein
MIYLLFIFNFLLLIRFLGFYSWANFNSLFTVDWAQLFISPNMPRLILLLILWVGPAFILSFCCFVFFISWA